MRFETRELAIETGLPRRAAARRALGKDETRPIASLASLAQHSLTRFARSHFCTPIRSLRSLIAKMLLQKT